MLDEKTNKLISHFYNLLNLEIGLENSLFDHMEMMSEDPKIPEDWKKDLKAGLIREIELKVNEQMHPSYFDEFINFTSALRHLSSIRARLENYLTTILKEDHPLRKAFESCNVGKIQGTCEEILENGRVRKEED